MVKGGPFSLPEKRLLLVTTDREGTVRISLPTGSDDPELRDFKNLHENDIRMIAVDVQHPNHPTWNGWFRVGVDKQLQLVDPTTVEIRAHRLGDTAALADLYPMLGATSTFTDWSAAKGGLVLHRVDLASDRPWRWLRVVRVPDKGPVWFSELIDLKQATGNPISIDVAMKPAVRVAGRLADDVPRPVKNGRVVAEILDGCDSWPEWRWDVSGEILPDGTFALNSLPANELLQVFALCDGWVSRSPSVEEVNKYAEKYHWGDLKYQGPSVSRHAHAQLARIDTTTTDITVPMDPTAACEVRVVDENDQPIANAEVHFRPYQYCIWPAGNTAAEGRDSITEIRTVLKSGKFAPVVTTMVPPGKSSLDRKNGRFSATTDRDGMAVITNFPAGALIDGAPQCEEWLTVSRDGYVPIANTPNPRMALSPDEPELLVKLSPGQITAITVQMHKRAARPREAPAQQKAQ
jgi:hypothetical protein